MKKVLAGVFLAAAVSGADACDLCAIYSAANASGLQPGWQASVFEQYTYFGTLREDGKRVANPVGQRMDSFITQLVLGYQFDNRIGVQVNVPWIYRTFRRAEDGAVDKAVVSGLGDVSVAVHGRVFEHVENDWLVSVAALGGVKFPTGNSGRLREELNEMEPPPGAPESGVHGHDVALGSGSVDGVVGVSAFTSWRRLFVTAEVQYAIRTTGSYHYRYANDLLWSAGPGVFLWVEHGRTLGVQFVVSGEAKAKDTLHGEKADDTGMVSVAVGPAATLTWDNRLTAELAVDVPVSQENTALQIVPDVRVRAGATWRF